SNDAATTSCIGLAAETGTGEAVGVAGGDGSAVREEPALASAATSTISGSRVGSRVGAGVATSAWARGLGTGVAAAGRSTARWAGVAVGPSTALSAGGAEVGLAA